MALIKTHHNCRARAYSTALALKKLQHQFLFLKLYITFTVPLCDCTNSHGKPMKICQTMWIKIIYFYYHCSEDLETLFANKKFTLSRCSCPWAQWPWRTVWKLVWLLRALDQILGCCHIDPTSPSYIRNSV